MKYNIGIKSVGIGLPNNYVTPDQLEKTLEGYDSSKRSFKDFCANFLGTKIFYTTEPNEQVSDIMAKAAKSAIRRAGISVTDIAAVISATVSPDLDKPGTRARVMQKIGIDNVSGIDIRAGCSGFPTSIHWTKDYVRDTENVPEGKYALYVCGDVLRKHIKPGDIVPSGLFSDGAFAAIFENCDEEYGIKSTYSKTRPALTDDASNDPEGYVALNGKVLKEEALKRFPKLILDALKKNNWKLEETLIAPHQMNGPINREWSQKLGIQRDNFVDAVHLYSNTSAASQGIALYELWKTGRLTKGAKIIGPTLGVGWDESYLSLIMQEDLIPEKRKIKLLMIDDDENVVQAQKNFIDMYFNQFSELRYLNNLEILIAKSSDEAIQMVSKEKFNAILADQRMPNETGGTGTDALEKILRIDPELLAVIVTGASEDEDRQIMNDLKNVIGYVTKPLIPDLEIDLNDPNPDRNKLRNIFNFFQAYDKFQE